MDESTRRIVGSFCTACHRRFATRFGYEQHRTSPFLIGTPCYALQRQNSELTADRRANLSTALLRSTSRSRTGSPLHSPMHKNRTYAPTPHSYAPTLKNMHLQAKNTYFINICKKIEKYALGPGR
jgi:hypothetical protein